MKKILAIWAICVFVVVMLWSCTAGAVTLDWDLNTDDTIGYNVYAGTGSGSYTIMEQATTPPYVITVPDGDWYFVVTAYDAAGNESGFSNEVSTNVDTVPPMVPGALRIVTN